MMSMNTVVLILLFSFQSIDRVRSTNPNIDEVHVLPELLIDCHPDRNATEDRCVSRGCLWIPSAVHPRAPRCVFANSDRPKSMAGYDATNGNVDESNREIFVSKLTRRPTPSLFGGDYERAKVKLERLTDEIVHVRVSDLDRASRSSILPHWRRNLKESRGIDGENENGERHESILDVDVEKSPFGFVVQRKSSGIRLVDTRRIPGFTFAEQYVQVSMRIPSRRVYGLGESTHEKLIHDFEFRKYGLFTRDHAIGDAEMNLFGVHPFYLCIEDSSGNSHGVFFLNSHALNVALQPDPSNPSSGGINTWRSIGGAIDFFILAGPRPDDVIRQYTSLIGRPQMPPYWALGFQLSRWGYTNMTHLEEILDRNRRAGIPVDTQVLDLDYFYEKMDFTYDSTAFANLSRFVEKLHGVEYEMRLVLIIDPALASQPNISYPPLDDALREGLFVRDARTGRPIEGRVWPGATYFLDFSHPRTMHYWTKWLQDFRRESNIDFDGIWIDMNEPSNFVDGSLDGCDENNTLNRPPYNPLMYENLNEMTLCMDAKHHAGNHYELHNLYALMEAECTYKALRSIHPQRRPFVLSRSTFAGSGAYTNHWTGDNASRWPQLKYSLVTILEFGMYGMPLMGADICGFHDEATEELCLRWHTVGAFYPFMRNHNDIGVSKDQDPAAWSEETTRSIRDALAIRYSLLPYLYTLLHEAHRSGTPVARALFFNHPDDPGTWDLDDQFSWGQGLMIAPIMTQGIINRSVYFPKGRWYDFFDRTEIPGTREGPMTIPVDIPSGKVGLYLRGGWVIPYQRPESTTGKSRRTPFGLYVALDHRNGARGQLYWDDGESIDPAYSLLEFRVHSNQSSEAGNLKIYHSKSDFKIPSRLQKIVIFGLKSKPDRIRLDQIDLFWTHISYDQSKNMLILKNLDIDLNREHTIEWF